MLPVTCGVAVRLFVRRPGPAASVAHANEEYPDRAKREGARGGDAVQHGVAAGHPVVDVVEICNDGLLPPAGEWIQAVYPPVSQACVSLSGLLLSGR